MNEIVGNYVSGMQLGELQLYENIGIVPLFAGGENGFAYLTMKEAMDQELMRVMEISEGGSVPELRVINKADMPVLILDGEELMGAKQNRVLNTSILLKAMSDTVIPVSCTEHGRWSYRSRSFEDSGIMMSHKLRHIKMASVKRSLELGGRHASDQGAIWDGIAEHAVQHNVHSPTGAMKDIHESRVEDLTNCMRHFPRQPRQKGLMALVNGRVAGMDVISREGAFSVLHEKLVKSYVIDAMIQKKARHAAPSLDKARAFLDKIRKCGEQQYQSPGHGFDYRYEGRNLVGSALVHEDHVIHMAFFMEDRPDNAGDMSGSSRRRQFRSG